jgi:ferric-dicitrate binding protein FerR (iron transport regulator)
VKIYPGATLRFDARGENVDLGLGRVWSSVEGGRGSYSVSTDRAVARVLGTSFVVERTVEGETDVRVIKGTVEVEDRERRGKVRVNASQRTRVGRSGAPSAPRHYASEGDANDWERFFRDIGRAFERLFKGQ